MLTLREVGLEKMWVRFGKGERNRWIPVHELSSTLGEETCNRLFFFLTFSGCDVQWTVGKERMADMERFR